MLKKDLAEALEISGAMVSKLTKRGMPVHSIDAARRWREKNLSPSHTKQFRAPPIRRHPTAPPSAPPLTVDQLVAMAELLAARLIDERDPWPEGLVHLRRMLDALPDEALAGLRLPERVEAMLYPDDDETAP